MLSVIAADRAVRSKTAYHFWLDQTWVIRNGRSSPLYRGYCSLYSKSVTLVKAGTSLAHLQVLCRYPAEGFVTRITKNIVSASFPQKLMWLYFFHQISRRYYFSTCVDHPRRDAFHEGGDLKSQIETYRARHGHYPEIVLGDPVYSTQASRRYLKGHGIRFSGKPLSRPKTVTEANREALNRLKAQRREDYLQRMNRLSASLANARTDTGTTIFGQSGLIPPLPG